MTDPSLFAILNTIGIWLAAIGTVSAVIVSLYLARRDSIIKLKIYAGHRILIGMGQEDRPSYLSIGITNTGFRKVTIVNLGWKSGFFKKTYAIQTLYPGPYSDNLPKTIADGEEARFLIPFKNYDGNPNWIDEFPRDFLDKYPKLKCKTLKLQVMTSLGKTFEVRVEKGLQEKLLESALRLKS